MSEREPVTSWPLYWPTGWKRTKQRSRARFGDTNTYRESQFIYAEMERMGAKRVVVSTNMELRRDGLPYANQRRPEDPGAAVWFWLPKPGVGRMTRITPEGWSEHVLACDRWDRVEHNLRAIGKHVEALRGQERWGVGSLAQSFAGYKALPSGEEPKDWYVVLGLPADASAEQINTRFKILARIHHPDVGGEPAKWHEIEAARRAALRSTP